MEVGRLSEKHLHEHLTKKNIAFKRGADGAFVFLFEAEHAEDADVKVTAKVVSIKKPTLAIIARSSYYIKPDDFPKALGMLNNWHKKCTQPTVYLDIEKDFDKAQFVAEGYFTTLNDVSQDLVDEFLSSTISASFTFFSWINNQNLKVHNKAST